MTHVKYLSHNDRFSLDAATADFVLVAVVAIIFLTAILPGRY